MSEESKLKLADTLLSILQKFDWIQPLIGAIGGIALGLWSGVEGKLGTSGAIAMGLLTFAVVLWIFNSVVVFLKNHASPKPEYEIWDQVQFLTLRQAALLWAEMSVTVKVLPEPAYARLRMLKEQIIVGALETLYDIAGEPDQNTLVTREDLVKVAEELRERPRFLFVESR
jgi:hypothetical protein